MFGFKKKERLSFNDPRYFIGKTGRVTIAITPYHKGQIYISATWFNAICEDNIILIEDVLVEVINIEENTLSVKPFYYCDN